MSSFRPAARARDPRGREWEIYAYKLRVRSRNDWDSDVFADPSTCSAYADAAGWVVNATAWLVMLVPRGVVRLGDAAVAAVRSLRSDEWTIEAVTWLPQQQRYAWTTTREFRGQVLAQVEGHLTRGNIPQHLTNATYLGEVR